MSPIFIPVAVLAFACNAFATRLFQTRFRDAARRLPRFQMTFCLVASFCFFAAGAFALPTVETLLYGLLFGVLFFLAVAMSARGYTLGSMALTSVIVNMSLLLPILYSILFLKEQPTVLHGIGFALFCGSVVSSALSAKDRTTKRLNVAWLVAVLLGFCSNGSTAILQKNYVLNAEVNQDATFLSVAYLTAAICFCVLAIVKTKQTVPAEKVAVSARVTVLGLLAFFGTAILSGVGSFLGNLLLGRLSVSVEAAILYPCINGGLAVFTTLLSFFFFREKPTLPKIVSILLGAAAIVVLNL